ncbi:MAG: hypothetical protein JW839_06200 [Candidatus Lokiarchaeota archaeon]|nr:hypothetical protein [Candidatus Lokiarchaeota archaeon]
MPIYMHVDGSPIPEGVIEDAEEAWEEIERYKKMDSEKSYILLEDREPGSRSFLAEMGIDGWYDFRRLAITPVEEGKWGLILDDEPEQLVGKGDLKAAVVAFFSKGA